MSLYAKIIIDKKDLPKNKPLDYLVPSNLESKIWLGCRVLVPLLNRKVYGWVVGLSSESEVPKVKSIFGRVDDVTYFSENMLKLAEWMSRYYCCTLTQTISAITPRPVNEQIATCWGLNFPIDKLEENLKDLTDKQQLMLNLIAEHNFQWNTRQLVEKAGTTISPLKSLQKKGLVLNQKPRVQAILEKPLTLNEEQKIALAALVEEEAKEEKKVCLLHGITGSGKTEIYLQLIDHIIKQGKQAIVLVPEIALTPQTEGRFKKRFGYDVAVWHSHLSDGEKFTQWQMIESGQAKIVVGARSALFAPFNNLGLIIIDEEHEFSYKQEESPRYHAREAAIRRAEIENVLVVLGSATPSLESYYHAQKGDYLYLSLKNRATKQSLPVVRLVDMREQLKNRNMSVLSRELYLGIKDRLEKKEQVILFLNRRGFSTFVNCRECGLVLTCPDCNVSLTYHKDKDILTCHYCDFQLEVPKTCPRCQSKYIKYFGTGTEKVEEAVKKSFPEARILRMDRDTTGGKNSYKQILGEFSSGKADILLGTQMIAKGLDIPNVTLVGVITADTVLNLPDFRSSEKTFQLLTQVAGRAGRGEKTGEVIIQTYEPEHYSIQAAKVQDFQQFYLAEIESRKELDYPPYCKIARIVVRSENEEETARFSSLLADELNSFTTTQEILGPVPAPVSKVRKYFRYHIFIKSKTTEENIELLEKWLDFKKYDLPPSNMMIDIEPMSLL